MKYISDQHDSSTYFCQWASGVVQHVGISATDVQIATVDIVSNRAILHQVERPHWFVIGIGKPGADIGDIGLAVTGLIHD